MSTYHGFPSLAVAPIDERTDSFRRASIKAIQQGFSLADMLQAKAEALEHERYEMAAGIDMAIQEFKQNPQLGLFL